MLVRRQKIQELPYTQENIDKYKAPGNLLRHARCTPLSDGVILVSAAGELIGYIGWEKNWIIAIEVTPGYRRQGYASRLIKRALDSGCIGLTVRNSNTPAVNLYKSLGFVSAGGINGRTNMILKRQQKQFTDYSPTSVVRDYKKAKGKYDAPIDKTQDDEDFKKHLKKRVDRENKMGKIMFGSMGGLAGGLGGMIVQGHSKNPKHLKGALIGTAVGTGLGLAGAYHGSRKNNDKLVDEISEEYTELPTKDDNKRRDFRYKYLDHKGDRRQNIYLYQDWEDKKKHDKKN